MPSWISSRSKAKATEKEESPQTEAGAVPPLRFGTLGAARITPNALVKPIQSHDEVLLVAVGARDATRANAFAKKWGIPKVYSGSTAYQDVIDDEEVDVIYNPLPNSLHFEWTMKALEAGKHVLCEKPLADTEEEARKMFDFAEKKGLILMECWQPQFHPAMHRVKAIIDEGSLGKIKTVTAQMAFNRRGIPDDDIRFDFGLGGGTLMDFGPYPINAVRYLTSMTPVVESAEAVCRKENIDRRIEARLKLPDDISATVIVDSALDGWGPFKLFPQFPFKLAANVECEHGSVHIFNFVIPSIFNRITITKHGKSTSERVYKPTEGKGESWWSAYRYQLEGFVDKVRGRESPHFRRKEDSLESMHMIDAIYTKAGLPLRPMSEYTPEY